MHEMSIVTGIWSTVVATLDSGDYSKLINVDVIIGEYLGVVRESLDLCWEAITLDDPRAIDSVLTVTLELDAKMVVGIGFQGSQPAKNLSANAQHRLARLHTHSEHMLRIIIQP